MKFFNFLLIIGFTTLWSETKSNFINEVRDKFGNSDKSYSVKMKSVIKDFIPPILVKLYKKVSGNF